MGYQGITGTWARAAANCSHAEVWGRVRRQGEPPRRWGRGLHSLNLCDDPVGKTTCGEWEMR